MDRIDDLKFQLLRTPEFNVWFDEQNDGVKGLILARLHRISIDGHFGFINHFDGLIELKWKSGMRIYSARIGKMLIVILGGGNKNGQEKDIKKAKKTLKKIQDAIVGSS